MTKQHVSMSEPERQYIQLNGISAGFLFWEPDKAWICFNSDAERYGVIYQRDGKWVFYSDWTGDEEIFDSLETAKETLLKAERSEHAKWE